MKYIIIGLGNFGSSLATTLCSQGHEVIGIDKRENIVQELKDSLTTTMCIDSTEEQALRQLQLFEMDAVVVAIGEDWSASIQTTALLKKIGFKRIIGRSISQLHKTIIEAIGVSEILNPELEAAKRITGRLASKNVVDKHAVSETTSVIEVCISSDMEGQSLGNIKFEQSMGLKLLAVKRMVEKENILKMKHLVAETIESYDDSFVLRKDDHVVLFGNTNNFVKFFGAINKLK